MRFKFFPTSCNHEQSRGRFKSITILV